MKRIFTALLLSARLLLAAPAAAQVPGIAGDDDSPAVRRAREILARRTYVWIDRDTVLGPEFRTPGDLVVYDAEVKLEGNVDGSVAVLGGDFWIRPGGRVGGAVAVLDGGVYPSGLAILERDSIFRQDPTTRVAIATVPATDGTYTASVTVTPTARPAFFAPAVGPFPTYDRVNGLTLSASANIHPTRRRGGPRLNVWGSYRFEQENHLGGGVRADLPLGRENIHLTAELSRATRTNDAWIYGDIANSLHALVLGNDYRDYWDADVLRVMVERPVGKPLIAGESWLGPRFGVQASRDRRLEPQNPWALLGDGLDRPNMEPLEGTIVSAVAGAEYHWRGISSTFDGQVNLEHALEGAGDVGFTQALVEGTYWAMALRTHTMRVYFRGMMPLGGGAPPQRFGILGGSGTLPTEEIAAFRGDHLAVVESSYLIPYPRVVLPYIGSPSLEIGHAVGAAWVGDASPDWVQNAGVGIVFPFVYARVLVNPADFEPNLSFGISLPQF